LGFLRLTRAARGPHGPFCSGPFGLAVEPQTGANVGLWWPSVSLAADASQITVTLQRYIIDKKPSKPWIYRPAYGNIHTTKAKERTTMAEKTYDLVFYDLAGAEDSTQSFNDRPAAEDALQLFNEPDSAEMYSRIALVEYNWKTKRETELKALTF
jgi:hypothetical protein